MLARDVMTKEVVTATPEMTVEALTRLLLDKRVSAVPVVDVGGKVLGMVSEADLIRRLRKPGRKKWWLAFLAESKEMAGEFIRAHGRHVEDVMNQPVVSVTEEAPVEEIARILEEEGIKRVPVVQEGRLVGIVTRRDLIRALAMRPAVAPAEAAHTDAEIHRRIFQELQRAEWLDWPAVQVTVADGIVHLWGIVGDAQIRKAVRVLVENIPGVKGVEDDVQIRRHFPAAEF
ncbi:MAG: CBS domain-containing protein [Candidatus Methylomirabilales bacterium]